jgi:hypothetical protein
MIPQETEEMLLSLIENELSSLHNHYLQRAKAVAHKINPRLTDEDLLNPDNFPDIMQDPRYTYADGLAAGILSAKMAIKAAIYGGSKD